MSGWSCACGATGLGGVRCPRCGAWAPWYAAPDEPPPLLPRRGLDGPVEALAAAIGLLLLAGIVAIDVQVRRNERVVGERFQAAVRELSDYVAAARGRPFLRPVEARLLPDDEFIAAFHGGDDHDDDAAGAGDFGATLYATGLAEPSDDVYGEAGVALEQGVVGFYDDERNVFYARGTDVTPFVRLIVVHELVHAWQDQHLDLTRLRAAATGDDEDTALSALVEGDATRVEDQWRAEQSAADRAAIAAAEGGGGGGGGDPSRTARTLGLLYGFPYEVGADFVTTLHDTGGNAAVDAAFADPPVSTEQVLHLDTYARRERPVEVAAPETVHQELDAGELGELGLLLLVSRGDVDAAAFTAVSGWGGDAYVTWDDGERLCTDANVVMDSRAARDRLARALRARAPAPDVRPAGARELRLTSCVPSPED